MPVTPRQKTVLIVSLGAALALVFGVSAWWNGRVSTAPRELLKRLPTQDAVVAGFDFSLLRRGGYLSFLSTAKAPEDPDYKAFVRDTGFDYKRDLDYVLVSFSPDGTFFLVKGAFDWDKLEAYALRQKGNCYQHLCRVDGSTPQRHISFFPLKHNLLAMAVAPDDTAAVRLNKLGPQDDIDVPGQPVWLSMSAGALRHSFTLPDSTRLFASAITNASRVTLTVGPKGADIEAHLDAVCGDPRQAGALTMQLQTLTGMLREAGRRPGQAATGNDLAMLLTAGTFEQAGSHVLGKWPIQKALIEDLTGGL
jgi:hypothetical protein